VNFPRIRPSTIPGLRLILLNHEIPHRFYGAEFERWNAMPSDLEVELESSDISETETIRLAQQGNAAAFEQIYRQYCKRVYSICFRMVKNDSEAEDLTQEAFLLLFRKIHTFRGESKLSTWLHRLTINVVLMKLRKKRSLEVSLDATLDSEEEDSRPLLELGRVDSVLNGVIDQVNLRRAIEQLPDGYRKIFILHDVEGYEHPEIAEILGCSTGNSKSQLFKARARMRELLQEVARSRARVERTSTPSLSVSGAPRFQCAKA
jgi:RNA polymerase sigma-70 factor (ECF subfamily)